MCVLACFYGTKTAAAITVVHRPFLSPVADCVMLVVFIISPLVLKNFKLAAEKMGHEFNFMFKKNIPEIPKYGAVFIRATTDPLYTSYIVSKTAWN